ncbi:MAG TPA: phosphotransferase family protein [Phenylobacterium sp.]|uniref:phosphotransferase family protein n=1 Tax=Phenylobacterium sp. TaxID=1871053 RepID=UPI002C522849|nr:phosphotransferase family protein [Phenylobacterium sp.]HSV02062.1 phosphotransferase family protein [Phenylobacterium sp.]
MAETTELAAERAREQANTGTDAVPEAQRFDEASLDRWMKANVAGYAGPLEVRKFKGGQSNPTYQLITPARKYVLRRKPPGKLLPSAHAVDREYRVITALYPTGFPVAKTYGLCTDDAVVGTWFYIMDNVEGRILWDQSLPQYDPAERNGIFRAKIKTLADLHNTDYVKIGLEDFGKPGNYMGRQVDRWTKQYKASETEHIPEMEKLIEWLPKTLPAQERTSIVHGDYRLDNMVIHPTEARVIAVLDWELSTLGEPLADFTYMLMNWVNGAISHIPDLKAHGIPTLEETVELYCELTGRSGVPDLNWYYAYNTFRLAGILQGIVGRVRDGTANSPHAAQQADRVIGLAQASWRFAQKAGAPA